MGQNDMLGLEIHDLRLLVKFFSFFFLIALTVRFLREGIQDLSGQHTGRHINIAIPRIYQLLK